jgi:hypothetical protein
MVAYRQARSEDALMLGVAKALDAGLVDIGKSAVREIVIEANRLGVPPDDLPYVFWALNTKAGLPKLDAKQQQALDMMLTIMNRTGVMPNYPSAFKPTDNLATDSAVDVVARHMGAWALRTMYPALLQAYRAALQSQVRYVTKLTNGQVKKGNEFEFLRLAFRQILSLQSRMFRDGELLRRVVRILPI